MSTTLLYTVCVCECTGVCVCRWAYITYMLVNVCICLCVYLDVKYSCVRVHRENVTHTLLIVAISLCYKTYWAPMHANCTTLVITLSMEGQMQLLARKVDYISTCTCMSKWHHLWYVSHHIVLVYTCRSWMMDIYTPSTHLGLHCSSVKRWCANNISHLEFCHFVMSHF